MRRALGRLAARLLRRGGGSDAHARQERERFFARARRFTPLLASETEHGSFLVRTEDTHIGRALFQKRRYGDKQIVLPSLILDSLGIRRGSVFVDVGAHVGTSTVVAIGACGFTSAWAFEPGPENFRLLRANLELNGLAESVRALPLALSSHSGTMSLAVNERRSGEHRLIGDDGAATARREGSTLVPVETTTLDELAESEGLPTDDVGLLKIDVEGHEAAVLAGATALLERGVPVVIEFAPELLAAAGGEAELEEIVRSSFTDVYDIRAGAKYREAVVEKRLPKPLPAARIAELSERYAAGRKPAFTDLLLVRR